MRKRKKNKYTHSRGKCILNLLIFHFAMQTKTHLFLNLFFFLHFFSLSIVRWLVSSSVSIIAVIMYHSCIKFFFRSKCILYMMYDQKKTVEDVHKSTRYEILFITKKCEFNHEKNSLVLISCADIRLNFCEISYMR